VTLDFAAFHNRHGDLLSLEPASISREQGRQVLRYEFRNLLRGRSSGLEASSGFQMSPHWVVRAQYSYLSLALETDPASTDTTSVPAEGASPRHNALVQSSWNLPGSLDLDVRFRWVDRLRSRSVPAYSSLDARLGWRIVPRLELAIVGHDLLHAHHAEFGAPAGRTEVERSVFGEITCRW
jgi:iron complex outermembrane receptor protein